MNRTRRHKCPHCGREFFPEPRQKRIKLRACHVRGLVALFEHGGAAKLGNLGLDARTYANFRQLQLWDFVGHRGSKWEITRRGVEFLAERESAAEYVRWNPHTGQYDPDDLAHRVWPQNVTETYKKPPKLRKKNVKTANLF